ncbi:thiamine-phosphate kinase [Rhabdaerophilum sp. SD176]|uniref:thiamine-phosphate kinase n=1 Tax=Rhabdaerophilum sp. SD176 TaxID=2983548 RepID=UPI0024E03E85|nr:thiamine-phosphate kinase [Rhabdaerophilum sp. SD176]
MRETLPEFEMIARLFAPMAGEGGLGLLDDCARLTPTPGHDLVLTKDVLVENVHYFAEDPPAEIARKALRTNLSDLAAKGARPVGFLLGLGRSPALDADWLTAFAAGLAEDSRLWGCPLLGGDTVRTGQPFLSVTAFGEVPAGRMVLRQAGEPGDALYVSGTIGDAALGLHLRLKPESPAVQGLAQPHRAFLLDRYLRPQPRLALVPVLLAHARAAMDISDGLVGDADKLAFRLGRDMAVEAVPLSPAARALVAADPALLDLALTGGDDYEILAAVPPEKAGAFERDALQCGVPVVKIGALLREGSGAVWRMGTGLERGFPRRSFAHF